MMMMQRRYLCKIFSFLWCTSQWWVPFRVGFPGQSLITIRISSAKRVDFVWTRLRLRLNTDLLLSPGAKLCQGVISQHKSDDLNKTANFRQKLEIPTIIEIVVQPLLLFICCNCNSAHPIKTRHVATGWGQKNHKWASDDFANPSVNGNALQVTLQSLM